ncbi:hypothetical protein Goshw_016317 [Gossypium schwendimanii]|uniref:Uncharacterized protein n=1 Tax=Gossypium schwendimanii TaxID=34291 RepID=A0A7J9KSM7_GOSSC|nr:hypothetical protein [Gossypium schwendimanii]
MSIFHFVVCAIDAELLDLQVHLVAEGLVVVGGVVVVVLLILEVMAEQ